MAKKGFGSNKKKTTKTTLRLLSIITVPQRLLHTLRLLSGLALATRFRSPNLHAVRSIQLTGLPPLAHQRTLLVHLDPMRRCYAHHYRMPCPACQRCPINNLYATTRLRVVLTGLWTVR